jgi:tetratricopeptide (TPR) repeat protein
MEQIRAFVGHSFREVDKTVVDTFLEFFDQLKGVVPHFSWERARAAEPKDLADKVMALIADKNTFIGICTKNEVVVPEGAFKPIPFWPSICTVPVTSLEPKTSDWIIQEIGLAKGRGMEIVLLVEEGLRKPGGLQGNIEYITFTRDRPQEAFGRIIEMIRALSPKPATSPSASEPASTSNDPEVPVAGDTNLTPKPEWALKDYSYAAFRAVFREQEEALVTVSGAFLGSPHNTGGDALAEWESDIEVWKTISGRRGSLEKLRKLSAQYPDNYKLLANLARSLSYFDDHNESAVTYLKATALAPPDKAIACRARAATEFATARQFSRAHELLEELRVADGSDPNVLKAVQEVGELRKDEDIQISVLERKVELAPDDFDARFSLAYKHAQIGNDDVALYHYLQVPHDSRGAGTWNNLGIQFDNFKMPSSAVKAYRAAEEKGETLAMSNLAHKFMQAGFLKEAKEMFERARHLEDYHKNVDSGLAELKDVPDNEEKVLKEALEKSHGKVAFYKALGEAVTKPRCAALDGRWKRKEIVLTCTVSGDTFRAVGVFEVKGGLGGLLFSGPQQDVKYQIEYECKLVGRTFEGTVKTKKEGEVAASLLNSDGKTKVLMYLSEDCRTIEVIENPHSTSPTFHSLKAV